MKKVNNTLRNAAFTVSIALGLLAAVIVSAIISNAISVKYPETCAALNQNDWTAVKEVVLALLALIIAPIGACFLLIELSAILFNCILKCDIRRSLDDYPRRYYVAGGHYTDDDRICATQMARGTYRNAYTVVIELTPKEVCEIFRYLRGYDAKYYEFRKSFLMPDNVSWIQPEISLRTMRHIMKAMSKDGTVLLQYRVKYPKKSQIAHTDDAVRIIANLHQPYSSEDIFYVASRIDGE